SRPNKLAPSSPGIIAVESGRGPMGEVGRLNEVPPSPGTAGPRSGPERMNATAAGRNLFAIPLSDPVRGLRALSPRRSAQALQKPRTPRGFDLSGAGLPLAVARDPLLDRTTGAALFRLFAQCLDAQHALQAHHHAD